MSWSQPSDPAFDLIRHVRNDLNGRTQVVATPFLGDHLLIDPPRADAVALRERFVGEPFVVAEVQVRFCAIVGHVHFAVLER